MTEIWKDIKEYEGLYQVSNLGRVKSLERKVYRKNNIQPMIIKEKVLKSYVNHTGRCVCSLYGHKNKVCLIHRLVAEAFIPNPNNYPQVNHRDENPLNNCVDNLEWCNSKYNINYGTAIERRTQKRRNGVGSKPVIQSTVNNEFVKQWPSLGEIERVNGYKKQLISKVCLGKQETSYGYKWRYAS